jgi:hypothetical protein
MGLSRGLRAELEPEGMGGGRPGTNGTLWRAQDGSILTKDRDCHSVVVWGEFGLRKPRAVETRLAGSDEPPPAAPGLEAAITV